MSYKYIDEVAAVRAVMEKRLQEANLVGTRFTASAAAEVASVASVVLNELERDRFIGGGWRFRLVPDFAARSLHIDIIPPWSDWVLRPWQNWRTESLMPVSSSDANHTAAQVTIYFITERASRRNIQYGYTDHTDLGTFQGRDNDWEEDFRKKFPIPE